MKVAIIENADQPATAEFVTDKNGQRLLFDSHYQADQWLWSNAQQGVVYQSFGDDDE